MLKEVPWKDRSESQETRLGRPQTDVGGDYEGLDKKKLVRGGIIYIRARGSGPWQPTSQRNLRSNFM